MDISLKLEDVWAAWLSADGSGFRPIDRPNSRLAVPTYRVGIEPLQLRKSFREVLCEQCGKSMGMLYVARIPKQLEGLSAEDVLNFYPYMKLDIQVHEKECPAQKKEDEPIAEGDL